MARRSRGNRRYGITDLVVDVFSAIFETIWGVLKLIGRFVFELFTNFSV